MAPHQDYVETVFTCVGSFDDPQLAKRLDTIRNSLDDLLFTHQHNGSLILKKVEPWNSVRITFKIPRSAAQRLRELARHGDQNLQQLGIMAVQIEGDQSISLTLGGSSTTIPSKNVLQSGLVAETSSSPSSAMSNSTVNNEGKSASQIDSIACQNIVNYLRHGTSIYDPELNNPTLPVATPSQLAENSAASLSGLHSMNLHRLGTPGNTGLPSTCQPHIDKNFFYPNAFLTSNSSVSDSKKPYPSSTQQFITQSTPHFPAYSPSAMAACVQRFPKASAPLLVNLLQTDPAFSAINNIATDKIHPDSLTSNMSQKKKRIRKPKETKRKKVYSDGGLVNLPDSDLTLTPSSLSADKDCDPLRGMNQIYHNNSNDRHLPPPAYTASPSNIVRDGQKISSISNLSNRMRMEKGLGHLVNPYTGVLEPPDPNNSKMTGIYPMNRLLPFCTNEQFANMARVAATATNVLGSTTESASARSSQHNTHSNRVAMVTPLALHRNVNSPSTSHSADFNTNSASIYGHPPSSMYSQLNLPHHKNPSISAAQEIYAHSLGHKPLSTTCYATVSTNKFHNTIAKTVYPSIPAFNPTMDFPQRHNLPPCTSSLSQSHPIDSSLLNSHGGRLYHHDMANASDMVSALKKLPPTQCSPNQNSGDGLLTINPDSGVSSLSDSTSDNQITDDISSTGASCSYPRQLKSHDSLASFNLTDKYTSRSSLTVITKSPAMSHTNDAIVSMSSPSSMLHNRNPVYTDTDPTPHRIIPRTINPHNPLYSVPSSMNVTSHAPLEHSSHWSNLTNSNHTLPDLSNVRPHLFQPNDLKMFDNSSKHDLGNMKEALSNSPVLCR